MVEVLNRCNYLYNNLIDCDDKHINENKNGDCLICTQNNFRGTNTDKYDCLKKLCTYTMFYGQLYVSEIYSFLVQSNFLINLVNERREYIKTNFMNGFNIFTQNYDIPIHLNIMSLGCGFGPDNIALNKYRDAYFDLNVNFNYYGYDKEPLWHFITQSNAFPITHDLLSGMNFKHIDILFINKLFSTLRNFDLHNDFLDIFRDALEELPIGAFVVFNDVNHYAIRDDFEEFANTNNLQIINKYYFDGHSYNYTHIPINIVTNSINNPSVSPKTHASQTIIFLYQKVVQYDN
ncbi:hypothetical protein [Aliarcobacter butzleri]|uniref:hypothetical protein n=1 Tax=Aliarcobacter butzleri TaxID=28197 RepID=UPI0021B4B855|nr:hypothetical protein [Aliarcobacter butzleri]MCT7567828.1 hypothetical protein [Aliarcobacter butzleri]